MRTIPLGHRAGGAKGAEVKAFRFNFCPLRRRSRLLRSLEPGGSWRIFGDFLFVRKSPGAPSMAKPCSCGAPKRWVQELSAPQKPPGRQAWQGHALAERLLWGVQRGRSPLASSSRSCGAERPLNPPLLFGIYRKEDKFFLSSTKTFCRNASPLCNTREIQKTLETAPFSSYNENRILPPGSLLHRAEEIGKTRRI